MIALLGFTASGKSTVEKEFVDRGYEKIVSYTTRPLRVHDNEVDGFTYHYINDNEFADKLNKGFFAENTSYKTEFGIWRYGMAKNDITDNKVCVVNLDGLKQLKKNQDLNIVSFYIDVNQEAIIEKLELRGDSEREYTRRIAADKNDFDGIENEVDFVLNNTNYRLTPTEIADKILILLNEKMPY